MSLATSIARRRAAGFGFFEPGWDGGLGPPPPPDPTWNPSGGSGGETGDDGNDLPWYIGGAPVIGVIGKTLSNIFGNQYQQPNTVYRPTQQYQGAPPPGSHYNSSGELVRDSVSNITNFITQNPLLIIGGVLGVVLLFRTPPGRR